MHMHKTNYYILGRSGYARLKTNYKCMAGGLAGGYVF